MATSKPSSNANSGGESDDFFIRFWGVRGTIACPGGEYARYGGNTSCIEVCCGDERLILDAGTGLRPLGVHLDGRVPIDVDIMLTHTHLDHIAGLPFFMPMFKAGNTIRLWAGHLDGKETLQNVIKRLMDPPLFPVPLSALGADIQFNDFDCGETLTPKAGVTLRTTALNHPNGATGYRVEYGGRSVCYVTDTEHVKDKPDENILRLIDGADIFIYDSTYTDDEYPCFKGWGHSTWQEGARLAQAAKVKTFVVFHHAPEHDDEYMDQISDAARQACPGALVSREGLVLRP